MSYSHEKTGAEMVLRAIENDLIYAFYKRANDAIVLDAKKLSKLVDERSCLARDAGVDFGDLELVWIAKFSSVVSHETIHKVLTDLEGHDTSQKFDNLYFPEFMEKIPKNSIHIILWSDAHETSSIGDT